MEPNITLTAFGAGLFSAISMPLGAITAMMWRPQAKVLSFLVAFGAGGLLAALFLDLVGSALDRGHLLELVIGALLGSLFFSWVNRWVNGAGGFLRKSSIMYTYMGQQKQAQLERLQHQLKQVSVFRSLPLGDLTQLAEAEIKGEFKQGTSIYRRGDPCESLYMVDEGKVEIFYRKVEGDEKQRIRQFAADEYFGQMAFLTGSPHATEAIALADTKVSILPRPDFCDLLQTSLALAEAMQNYIQSEEVAQYLGKWHNLNVEQIKIWVRASVESISTTGELSDAVVPKHQQVKFLQILRQAQRFPIFQRLPAEDAEELASRVLYTRYDENYTFFNQNEAADRLFFIDQGRVSLISPTSSQRRNQQILGDQDIFGGMAFLTGSCHAVTAVSVGEIGVWVLRKHDFEELLKQSPALEGAVKAFLQRPEISTYLQTKQGFNPTEAATWSQAALKSMNAEQLIPSAAEMAERLRGHGSAPIAIWLGLLLDGIPESLVIGANAIHALPGLALIVGVFLSNYPEALSSSEGMRQQGFSTTRILIMWSSIMILTGTLAALGSVLFVGAPDSLVSLVEAMAAGAMLTVIAETMLPEAYAKGGSVVGISTLLGFLVIICVKALEPIH